MLYFWYDGYDKRTNNQMNTNRITFGNKRFTSLNNRHCKWKVFEKTLKIEFLLANQPGTPPYGHLRGYKRLNFFWHVFDLQCPFSAFLFSSLLYWHKVPTLLLFICSYPTQQWHWVRRVCKSGAFTLFWWHKDIWWCQFRHYSDYYYSIFSLHSYWLGQFSQIWLTLLNREK